MALLHTVCGVVLWAAAGPIFTGHGHPPRVPCLVTEQDKLVAPDAAAGDHFGFSVGVSGDTVVVGSRLDDDACPGDPGCDSGSAHVFVRNGALWLAEDKLTASDAEAGDQFGFAAAISGDTVVVGAHWDDDACPADPDCDSGSAYVFVRNGTTWTEQAKLTASDAATGAAFGSAVAVDVNTAIVGAPGADGPGGAHQGAAYVFVRDGTTWSQQTRLADADGAADDQLGSSVAISGETAVVGAGNDSGPAGSFQGSAVVFLRNGTAWAREARLTAADAAAGDRFGYAVAVGGDTVLIGAIFDGDAGANSGSAYVFVRTGGAWSQEAKLTAADAAGNDRFGVSVSISSDTAIIGALFDDDSGDNSGSAYVFTRGTNALWDNGSTDQAAKLLASDGAFNDQFGLSVSIDGATGVIGAIFDDDGGSSSGSAYAFGGLADCNANDALDVCDVADGTSLDCNLNATPDECEFPGCPGILPADMDCDGDTDGQDLPRFVALLVAGGYTCQADLDQNGLLDLTDATLLVSTLTAP